MTHRTLFQASQIVSTFPARLPSYVAAHLGDQTSPWFHESCCVPNDLFRTRDPQEKEDSFKDRVRRTRERIHQFGSGLSESDAIAIQRLLDQGASANQLGSAIFLRQIRSELMDKTRKPQVGQVGFVSLIDEDVHDLQAAAEKLHWQLKSGAIPLLLEPPNQGNYALVMVGSEPGIETMPCVVAGESERSGEKFCLVPGLDLPPTAMVQCEHLPRKAKENPTPVLLVPERFDSVDLAAAALHGCRLIGCSLRPIVNELAGKPHGFTWHDWEHWSLAMSEIGPLAERLFAAAWFLEREKTYQAIAWQNCEEAETEDADRLAQIELPIEDVYHQESLDPSTEESLWGSIDYDGIETEEAPLIRGLLGCLVPQAHREEIATSSSLRGVARAFLDDLHTVSEELDLPAAWHPHRRAVQQGLRQATERLRVA